MDPMVSLVRRWALGWVTLGDTEVAETILSPEYRIRISGTVLDGRVAYIAGGLGQIERFAGWSMTVHDLVCTGDRAAVRFTLSGADSQRKLRTAAWSGVAMFRWDGRWLTECFAEEDYFSRRRQLADGRCDAIDSPAPAPWNASVQGADPAAEAAVSTWLQTGRFDGAAVDDELPGSSSPLIEEPALELHELFSAGDRVAFHGRVSGAYSGGLDGSRAPAGAPAAYDVAGLVRVAGGAVAGGQVVRDRLGMLRELERR